MDRWALTDNTAIHLQPISSIIYSLHSASLLDKHRGGVDPYCVIPSGSTAGMKFWMNIKMHIKYNEHFMLWIFLKFSLVDILIFMVIYINSNLYVIILILLMWHIDIYISTYINVDFDCSELNCRNPALSIELTYVSNQIHALWNSLVIN